MLVFFSDFLRDKASSRALLKLLRFSSSTLDWTDTDPRPELSSMCMMTSSTVVSASFSPCQRLTDALFFSFCSSVSADFGAGDPMSTPSNPHAIAESAALSVSFACVRGTSMSEYRSHTSKPSEWDKEGML